MRERHTCAYDIWIWYFRSYKTENIKHSVFMGSNRPMKSFYDNYPSKLVKISQCLQTLRNCFVVLSTIELHLKEFCSQLVSTSKECCKSIEL